MKKHLLLFVAICLVPGSLLTACRDTDADFSPGAGDPRITGTWQLYERRFLKDSSYTVRIDTVNVIRDTTYYSLKRYSSLSPQTLAFGTDGRLTASGSEMTYYYPIRHFRLDSTISDGLVINLFISTNRANVPFRERVAFRQDTLVLLPRFVEGQLDQDYYLKLLRVR